MVSVRKCIEVTVKYICFVDVLVLVSEIDENLKSETHLKIDHSEREKAD